MKWVAALLTLVLAGCHTAPERPTIVQECAWTFAFEWTVDEADAIVDASPGVAKQLLLHNKLRRLYCEGEGDGG